MSTNITPEEQARYAELAERMEASQFGPIPDASASGNTEAELDELLAQIDDDLIDDTRPTPSRPVGSEAISSEAVRTAVGRPSLSGTGSSPVRQVRLPNYLDLLLEERVATEHRNASDIMRAALEEYLHAS